MLLIFDLLSQPSDSVYKRLFFIGMLGSSYMRGLQLSLKRSSYSVHFGFQLFSKQNLLMFQAFFSLLQLENYSFFL